ncbi:PREDICTED: group IID secretory phospholipase A2-like [Apaloderma vittatum]|nr:PREDICTED: group IID secretory phospholipase A2-like [Apaloderma vittatum]
MKALLTFAVLLAWGSSPAHGSLWELQKMIKKVTGKNAFLHYAFYGCYCGLGGKGEPKDATDRCCQLHDTCYDREGSWCARFSCECDRSLALCLKRNIGSYSKRFSFYLKDRCR